MMTSNLSSILSIASSNSCNTLKSLSWNFVLISLNFVVTSSLTLATDSLKLAYSSLDFTEVASCSNLVLISPNFSPAVSLNSSTSN